MGETMTNYLGREAILAADDRQYDDIEVPEWGGTVRVRGMSGAQRDDYEASIIEQRGNDRKVNLRNARAKLVARCVVDGEGKAIFTTDDISSLGRKSAVALERVFDAARRLSGMTEGDVERLAENFEDDPSGDATSD
jgi:hypothetical protein